MTDAPKPLGMSDFFALEAGEYLERLDGLLAKGDNPSADEIVRLARALRGSALMANRHAIARTAAGLEALARAVREGRRAWDPQTHQLAIRGVDDLKVFVRQAGSWTDADTAKAEALALELEQVAGRPSAQIRAVEALGLDAGARAFVAREGAAIAGALERAAQALRANPLAHDPLQHVMRALQPLRGLAALSDLPPLPDLLEGIERSIGELSRSGLEPPANVGDLFQVAGSAIARAAREVAERGRPDPEGADFRQFAGLLVKFMESEPDAVSIGSLYYSDSGPHIVSRGVPAARPSALGKLELVSHGEHLRQAADSLERAPSATQRELRAHTLGTTFRALANAGGGVLADRVAQFAIAAREAVASGIAVSSAAAFAAELRRAGDLLARSGAGDEEALATELDSLTAALRTIQPGAAPALAAPAPRPAPTPAPLPAPPRAATPAVPSVRAAPARAPAPVSPQRADLAVAETPDLVGSWAAYQRLAAGGFGAASLTELVAGTAAVERVPAPAPSSRGPSGTPLGLPAPTPPSAEPPAVDVRTLLYRGDRALRRAQELRAAAKQASGDDLRELVEEVCDLVALALEPSP
jgi:HPt (histidine-containing phosphotransfer) domain-containing protein